MLKGKLYNRFTESVSNEQEYLISLDQIFKIMGDQELSLSWTKSKRGVSALRCTGVTNGRDWNIDIYKRSFLFARVGNIYDTFDCPRKAIDFIRAHCRSINNGRG